MSAALLDWPALMRVGLVELRLVPAVFWDLTPVELLMMAGLDAGRSVALTREELDALRARFPDETRGDA